MSTGTFVTVLESRTNCSRRFAAKLTGGPSRISIVLGGLLLLAWMVTAGGRLCAAEPVPSAENAVLVYWQAFALAPELSDEEELLLSRLDEADFDAGSNDVRALVDGCSTSLDLLAHAVTKPACDWQLVENGPATLIPHLSKIRRLARLSLLRARMRLNDRDHAAAVADLLATTRLARDADDPTLVSMLVGQAIEREAMAVTRLKLEQLPPAEAARLQAGLARLPSPATFADAMAGERDMFGNWLVETINNLGGDKTDDLLKQLGAPLALLGASTDQLKKWSSEYIDKYDETIRVSQLPPDEARKKLTTLEQEVTKDSNPFSAMLLPAVSRAFESHLRFEADRAKFAEEVAARAKS